MSLDEDKLRAQTFYDLELSVQGSDGRSGLVQTRTPFMPVEGSRITVRTREPARGGWPDDWREVSTTYRVVGKPSLLIDEVVGDSATPDITIECDVEREER